MPDFPRVVVTGIGMVTPVGLDTGSSWESLLASRSGLGRITHFDPAAFDVQIAAEVKGFEPEDHMDRRTARRSGRHTQLAVVAANEAVAAAGLRIDDSNRDGIGVVLASSGTLFTHRRAGQDHRDARPSARRPLDGAARRPVQRLGARWAHP